MATSDASTMDLSTDYEASITTIDESTDGSTSDIIYLSSSSTTYFTTEQWRTTYYTREYTTYSYAPPYYPESNTSNTFIIILVIILCLGCIVGFICCYYKNQRDKQQSRNFNNAVLMANTNNNLRSAPTHPQGANPFTSVTFNDQLPDYDAVMMEPTAPRPQLIIRSFTQEDDSPPPNYVTPDVIPDSNATHFTLPLPPTYEEATSQPNLRRNSFTEIPLT